MKIYTKCVFEWANGQLRKVPEECESFDYEGPIASCDPATILQVGTTLIGAMGGGDGASYSPASSSVAAGAAGATDALNIAKDAYTADQPYRNTLRDVATRNVQAQEANYEAGLPIQQTVRDEAAVAGNEEMQNRKAAAAEADVNAAAEATQAGTTRTLSALGLAKPGDPNYTANLNAFDLGKTATLAKAGTDARTAEFNRGVQQRQAVAGQQRTFNPGFTTTSPNAVSNAANTLVSAGNAQAGLADSQYSRNQSERTAMGTAAGDIIGQVFKSGSGGPSNTGVEAPPVIAAEGGPIDGPSHAKGGVPIEAEGGEFILKKDSVKKYGPRLLSEVNEGTAIIVPTHSPRRLKVAGGENAKAA